MGVVQDRLVAMGIRLEKARDEIVALVQQLRDEVANNAVQSETLDSLEAVAQSLDDVVPFP